MRHITIITLLRSQWIWARDNNKIQRVRVGPISKVTTARVKLRKITHLIHQARGLMLGLYGESYDKGPGSQLLEPGLGSYRIRAKVGDRVQLGVKD